MIWEEMRTLASAALLLSFNPFMPWDDHGCKAWSAPDHSRVLDLTDRFNTRVRPSKTFHTAPEIKAKALPRKRTEVKDDFHKMSLAQLSEDRVRLSSSKETFKQHCLLPALPR
jgi:hypothetical protein